MTDRDVVERVAQLLDRAVVTLRPQQQHHKTPFAATIKGAPAVDLMVAVHDFMGTKRRGEIQRAILSWHKSRSHRRRTGPCAVAWCARRASKRGLCKRHYNRWWKAHRYRRASAITPPEVVNEFQGHDYPVLKVSMCTESVVTRASRLVAAASVTMHEPEEEGWSVVYAAAISGSDAAIWMRRLRDHMGCRRTEAIDAAGAASATSTT